LFNLFLLAPVNFENQPTIKIKRMSDTKKNRKVCSKGHVYYKSSDCPTCPVCEQERKPGQGFLSLLAAPARRALEQAGIHTLKELSKYSELEILQLHGMGKSSIPTLKKALESEGWSFETKKTDVNNKKK
jgi:predicted RecB family nuclease